MDRRYFLKIAGTTVAVGSVPSTQVESSPTPASAPEITKRVFQKLIVGPSPRGAGAEKGSSEKPQGGHEGRSRRCWFYRRCRPTKPWGFAAGRSQSNF